MCVRESEKGGGNEMICTRSELLNETFARSACTFDEVIIMHKVYYTRIEQTFSDNVLRLLHNHVSQIVNSSRIELKAEKCDAIFFSFLDHNSSLF